MKNSRFLECLAADYQRILAVVPGHMDLAVPSCPGWSVADLTRHVGEVYLHKAASMREGGEPAWEWPPPELANEEPVGLLERAYAELVEEFAARKPEDVVGTWYGPDPTVGFWIRRMAQETVVHRIDAELGVGIPIAPVPDDLAIDGVDELLKVFVAFAVSEWPADFTDEWPKDATGAPASPANRTYEIRTDGASWLVKTAPGHFDVTGGAGVKVVDGGTPDVVVQGAPAALLRWAWNREMPGAQTEVTIDGDLDALPDFRQYVVIATQ
jgi:uncharacterized protein (TIGR03083 family)